MYCIVLSIRLFSKEECRWWLSPRNLHAWGYHVPSSIDAGCLPYTLTKPERHISATNMFLSLEIDSARICLFSGSIPTNNQMNSNPTLNQLCFVDDKFWNPFFSLIISFWDDTIESISKLQHGFLVDKPRKYKYNARLIADEDVLFLVSDILEIGHL